MNLVYGPVISARFGSTIGINLLGEQKVCSYNCIYCDLGPSQLTMNKIRKEYEFPSLEIISTQFKEFIRKSVKIETIVVSGNGEPTLYPDFDDAMKTVMTLRDEHLPGLKIVVLSNGAHLDSRKVISGLNLIDERVIKVDVGNDALMEKVNDPLVRTNLSKMIPGIRKLNDCIVQTMLYKTDSGPAMSAEQIDEWIEILGMIKPKAVQLCNLSRPSLTKSGIKPLDEDSIYSIVFKLKKRIGLEADVFNSVSA